MAISLADMIAQGRALNEQQAGQAGQIAGFQMEASSAQRASAEEFQLAASAAREEELTKVQGELAAQQKSLAAAQAFGTDVGGIGDVITGLAHNMRNTAVELTAAEWEAARLEANSDLFGNPMGWLEDLVRGDAVRGKADTLRKMHDTQAALAQNLNAMAQSTARTQDAIKQTLNADSAEQAAQVKFAEVQAQAANAASNAASHATTGIRALMQQGDQEFGRNAQLYGMQVQAEQLAAAREARAEARAKKERTAADLQETLDNVNFYNRMFNRPEVSPSHIEKYLMTSGRVGAELREADVQGMRLRQGNSAGVVGMRPSEAIARISEGSLQLPQTWAPMEKVLMDAQDEFAEWRTEISVVTKKRNDAGMKGEQLAAEYDRIAQQKIATYQANIEAGTGNPFEAPTIENVLDAPVPNAQKVAQSKFRKFVLDPLVAAGNQRPDPELLLSTAVSAMERGELTQSEVVDAGVSFYRAATDINAAMSGASALGLQVEPKYSVPASFITRKPVREGLLPDLNPLSGSGFLSRKVFTTEQLKAQEKGVTRLNLTSTADFTLALTVLQSKKRAEQIKTPAQSLFDWAAGGE